VLKYKICIDYIMSIYTCTNNIRLSVNAKEIMSEDGFQDKIQQVKKGGF
jgi:hypothetical protein